MNVYIRLKPHAPRQGFETQRLHWKGNLFQGGQRPTWYMVTAADAEEARTLKQESGAPMFDIVTEDEKTAIDQKENAYQAVALGIAAATVALPSQASPVDLTAVRRSAAIPPPPPPAEATAAAPPAAPGNLAGVGHRTANPIAGQARGAAIPSPLTQAPGPGFEEAPGGDLSTEILK